MKIAVILPPWLQTPPDGYGGIEALVHVQVEQLEQLGHQTVLFTVSGSRAKASRKHWFYEDEQYYRIADSLYDCVHVPVAHIQYAIDKIKAARQPFDIVHDHSGPFVSLLAWANIDAASFPPILHTLHGPLPSDQRRELRYMAEHRRQLYFNGISQAQLGGNRVPPWLQTRLSRPPVVYNAVDLDHFPFQAQKQDYWLTLARFTKGKGQHIAARICSELGQPLKMAGSASHISHPQHLEGEITGDSPDIKYFVEKVRPFMQDHPKLIEFLGNVSGQKKTDLISRARGLLFPIQWQEPFGVAVIEALACGTPVVAMNRGAMSEIIEHGHNGFLAETETEFKGYMQRIDQIDPSDCRHSVEARFSAAAMAEAYHCCYLDISSR